MSVGFDLKTFINLFIYFILLQNTNIERKKIKWYEGVGGLSPHQISPRGERVGG